MLYLIFFSLPCSTDDLPAPPEVAGRWKSVVSLYFSASWAVWPTRVRLTAVSFAVCFADIFHSIASMAPGCCSSHHWLFHLCSQFSVREGPNLSQAAFPPAVNSPWLADWLGSCAASFNRITRNARTWWLGGREAIANLSGLVQGVSSPPLRYQKLHLTRGSLNGPLSFWLTALQHSMMEVL